jgi:hypothetical protein
MASFRRTNCTDGFEVAARVHGWTTMSGEKAQQLADVNITIRYKECHGPISFTLQDHTTFRKHARNIDKGSVAALSMIISTDRLGADDLEDAGWRLSIGQIGLVVTAGPTSGRNWPLF